MADGPGLLTRMESIEPGAVELAQLLAYCARIERPLLREVRLQVTPHLSVADEAKLWCSPAVLLRGIDGLQLRPDVAEILRLRARAAYHDWPETGTRERLLQARAIAQRHHHGAPQLVRLEEDLGWLTIASDDPVAESDNELRPALAALVREGRMDVARWAAHALPRLPESVKSGTTALLLAGMTNRRLRGSQQNLNLMPPAGTRIVDVAMLASGLSTRLGVQRRGAHLDLGAVGPDGFAISIPETDPRLIEVAITGQQPVVVGIPAGALIRVEVGQDPVRLRSAAGDSWTVGDQIAKDTTLDVSESTRRMAVGGSSLGEAIDALEADLTYGESNRTAEFVDAVILELPAEIGPDDQRQLRRAMRVLRRWRCFAQLGQLCQAIEPEPMSPFDIERKRFWAQALIDQGRLARALRLLDDLRPAVEQIGGETKSEVYGLLGQLHKDRFLTHGGDLADLEAAIGFYRDVYELDPSWHGANLVALTAYAERAGLDVGAERTAAQLADDLLKLLDERDQDRWEAWYWAAAGEAQLLLDSKEAAAAFTRYWSVASPYALAGTERQLGEVWLPHNPEGDEFIRSLMAQLKTRYLSTAGADMALSPSELIQLHRETEAETGEAEALFGPGAAVPLNRVRRLLKKSASICRIRDRGLDDRGGSGFLVEGADLHPSLAGQRMVITNDHVLPGDDRIYEGSVRLDRAVAEFQFWDRQEPKEFRFDRVLYSSPRHELDLSIAALIEAPGLEVEGLKLSTESAPFRYYNTTAPEQRDQVFVVGHPGGRELSFSFSDNEVVDHELSDKVSPADGLRRIHYRTPLENASSGSPVFHHENLEVVGLHRTGRAAPLRDPWPGKAQGHVPYHANEAISIVSIREFLAQAINR